MANENLNKETDKEYIDEDLLEKTSSIDLSKLNIQWRNTDYSVNDLLDLVASNDMKIPIFQRNYVWTKQQAEEFIESLLIGIPIPSIYISSSDDINGNNNYQIIDGQQRIMTLYNFIIKTKFSDNDKNTWKMNSSVEEWNKKSFLELGQNWQTKLKRSKLQTIIITQRDKNEFDLFGIFNVFARINKTGTKLSNQQIRSSLYFSLNQEKIANLSNEQLKNNTLRLTDAMKKNGLQDELILRAINLYRKILLINGAQQNLSLTKELNFTADWLRDTKNKVVYETIDLLEDALKRYIILCKNAKAKNSKNEYIVFYCPNVSKNATQEYVYSNSTSPLIFETIIFLLMKNRSFNSIDLNLFNEKMSEQTKFKKDDNLDKSAFYNNTNSDKKIERRIKILESCLKKS